MTCSNIIVIPACANYPLMQEINLPVRLCPDIEECCEVTLYLVNTPTSPNFNDFFSKFVPKPNFVLFSATGKSLANRCNHSDVVVVTRLKPTVISGEVQHVTSLWRFREFKKSRVSVKYNTTLYSLIPHYVPCMSVKWFMNCVIQWNPS